MRKESLKKLVSRIWNRKQEKTYYRLDRLDATGALYRIAYGKRSKGKTYALLEKTIAENVLHGTQLAYIRRWKEDFSAVNNDAMWNGILADDLIRKYTQGQWTGIYLKSRRWYFCKTEKDGSQIVAPEPLVLGFTISQEEHERGSGYRNARLICLDEFISRGVYLENEFPRFQNLLSTIIRDRGDAIIYMFGNTVNQYCPYFSEMGLKHIREQQPGTIDFYTYGEDGETTVAVEFTEAGNESERSNKYFGFDNPKLKMITSGAWEIKLYPHLPESFEPWEVVYRFYIQFSGDTLQAEVIKKPDSSFVFIHKWTSPITDPRALVFTPEHSHLPNFRRRITRPTTKLEDRIAMYFRRDKVFYATNEIGEIVRNYLLWCRTPED